MNAEEELNECNQMVMDYFVLRSSLIVLLEEPNPQEGDTGLAKPLVESVAFRDRLLPSHASHP